MQLIRYMLAGVAVLVLLAGCGWFGTADQDDSAGSIEVTLESVNVQQTGLDRILVSWDAQAGGGEIPAGTTYEVHVGTTAGGSAEEFIPDASLVDATSAEVSGLNPGSTIYAAVRTVDEDGEPLELTEEVSLELQYRWTVLAAGTTENYKDSVVLSDPVSLLAGPDSGRAYVGYTDAFDSLASAAVIDITTGIDDVYAPVPAGTVAATNGALGLERAGDELLVAAWNSDFEPATFGTPLDGPGWESVALPALEADWRGAHLALASTSSGVYGFYWIEQSVSPFDDDLLLVSYDGTDFTTVEAGFGPQSIIGSTTEVSIVEPAGARYVAIRTLGVFSGTGDPMTEITGDLPDGSAALELVVVEGELYAVVEMPNDDGLAIFRYGGDDSAPSWTETVSAAEMASGAAAFGNGNVSAAAIAQTIVVSYTEITIPGRRLRVLAADLSSDPPTVQVIAGEGPDGFNRDPTYDAYFHDLTYRDGRLTLSWAEETGSVSTGGIYTAIAD